MLRRSSSIDGTAEVSASTLTLPESAKHGTY